MVQPEPVDKITVPLNTEKIRELREKRGWSIADAAERAGFKNRAQWYHVESGDRTNVTLETLERIARALGVQARDLLIDVK